MVETLLVAGTRRHLVRAVRRLTLLDGAESPAAVALAVGDRARLDLGKTAGFLVADVRGRVVGRVEGPMYGAWQDTPDALSVRFGVLPWRRRLVPAAAIEAIDEHTKVIGLRIERTAIKAFL
jgi:hypothetical protein